MKRVLWKFAKWGGVAFAALLALTVVMEVADPEGMKKAREENAKASAERAAKKQAAEADEKKTTDRIFTNGFAKGFSMAKGGAVKPSSDEVDALARRAAQDLGDSGGLGFKMAWKNAFWAGWRKGD